MKRKVCGWLIVGLSLILGLTSLLRADDVITANNTTIIPTLMQSEEFEVLDQADSSEVSCAGWTGGFLNVCFGLPPQAVTETFQLQLMFPNPPNNSKMVSGTVLLDLTAPFSSTNVSTASVVPVDTSSPFSFYSPALVEFSPATQVTIDQISSPTYSVDFQGFNQPCPDLSYCEINLENSYNFSPDFESPITITGSVSLSLADGNISVIDPGSNADTILDVNSELGSGFFNGSLFATFTQPPPPPFGGGNGSSGSGGGAGAIGIGGGGGSTPTPEPTTLLLFGTGVLGVVLMRRRRYAASH